MCIREVLKFSKVHKVQQFAEPPTRISTCFRSPRIILDCLYIQYFWESPHPVQQFAELYALVKLGVLPLYLCLEYLPQVTESTFVRQKTWSRVKRTLSIKADTLFNFLPGVMYHSDPLSITVHSVWNHCLHHCHYCHHCQFQA